MRFYTGAEKASAHQDLANGKWRKSKTASLQAVELNLFTGMVTLMLSLILTIVLQVGVVTHIFTREQMYLKSHSYHLIEMIIQPKSV